MPTGLALGLVVGALELGVGYRRRRRLVRVLAGQRTIGLIGVVRLVGHVRRGVVHARHARTVLDHRRGRRSRPAVAAPDRMAAMTTTEILQWVTVIMVAVLLVLAVLGRAGRP
jgi:hypothetical protein